MTTKRVLVITLIVSVACAIGSCKKPQPAVGPAAPVDEKIMVEKPDGPMPKFNLGKEPLQEPQFGKWYEPVVVEVTPAVKGHALPLDVGMMKNLEPVQAKLSLSDEGLAGLTGSGAVVIQNPFFARQEYFTPVYEKLESEEIPIFVTTDSMLHAYHVMFDATLRSIEETKLYQMLFELLEGLLDDAMLVHGNAQGEVAEAAKRNVGYLSVAMRLMVPTEDQVCDSEPWECPMDVVMFTKDDFIPKHETPGSVAKLVEAELSLISEHSGFIESPIFVYKEDYSQYVPRGHYTASERLKNYFKAFMWLGRIAMLLQGGDGALVDAPTARIQTMQAALLAGSLVGHPELMKAWQRIYAITAFFVGLSDDLGPYQYVNAMREVFGDSFYPGDLDAEKVGKLKALLAEHQPPKINGGTGDCTLTPPFTTENANECLASTSGMRFMGQRFIPDSYMFSQLVFPAPGMFIGGSCDAVFTCSQVQFSPQRVMPRGLDVMTLLGSARAPVHMSRMGDSSYEKYGAQMDALEKEFAGFSDADWHRNLYWGWLDALSALLVESPEGTPTFMRTDAWRDKQLEAALASWTELRHDTILYAKQSYALAGAGPPPQKEEKPVVGYVEPVPEFYARLLALTRMTIKGLTELDALDQVGKMRLARLETIIERLMTISVMELEAKPLTEADTEFIKNFAKSLDGVIGDVQEKTKRTAIVADVHTDANSSRVLEEAVGYIRLLVVAYRVPDGRILVGAGPVFSYYEFTHPMSDRLTDESWRELLEKTHPDPVSWSTIHAGSTQKPTLQAAKP